MKYLLDSDVVNILYDDTRKKHHDTLHGGLSLLQDEDLVQTSVLVLCELEYSFFNAPDDKKPLIRGTIDSIHSDFDAVLPLTSDIAPLFGKVKALLKQTKNLDRKAMRKHNVDIMLAATAIQTSSVLVGHDTMYRDIAQLHENFHHENWFIPL